ncbi:MAG TPA: Ig-like domain-containing protein, partial [Albitalea sp.]|nr:Ig-like domain-containing protein [Albitalea sp.]
ATDADLPAQALTYAIAGGADAARFTIDASTGQLQFAVAPDAEAPADADLDNVYLLVVRAGDSSGASSTQSLQVRVTGVDEAPQAVADAAVGDEDQPLSGNVLANDIDADSPVLVATLTTAPAHGQLTLAADGSFTYRPSADWFGTDQFSYRVSDGGAGVDGLVTLTVQPVNDAAVITAARLTVTDGAPVVLGPAALAAADVDTDSAAIVFEVGSIAGGRIEHVNAPGVAVTVFSLADVTAGSLRVVPTQGPLQITLRTSDGVTPGDWVTLRIDTLAAGPGLPDVAPVPPVVPVAAAQPPALQAAHTPVQPAASQQPPAATSAGTAVDRPDAAGITLPAGFATDRGVAAGGSGAAHAAGSAGDDQDDETTQLVIDLRLEAGLQPPAPAPVPTTGGRTLAIGDVRPAAIDDPSMEDAAQQLSMGVEAIEVVGLSLTVGIIWWALRLAGVAGSLLASLPAWSMIDPLPILGTPPADDEDDDDDAAPGSAADDDAAAEVLLRGAEPAKALRR